MTPSRGPRRPTTRVLVRIGLTAALCVYLSRTLDLRALWAVIPRVRWGLVVASYAVLVACELLIAKRLQTLMGPTRLHLSVARLLRIGFIAKFYALVLPGGVGPAVAKWVKITGARHARLQLGMVLLVEKLLFLFTTALSVGSPLLLLADARLDAFRAGLVSVSFGVAFVAVAAIAVAATGTGCEIRGRLALPAIVQGMRRVGIPPINAESLSIFRDQWRVLAASLLMTLAVQAGILFRIALLFRAVRVELVWPSALWISAFVFFLQTMPISIAGLGVRESAFAYSFHLFGLRAEAGALVGLLFFLQMAVGALVGGVLEWTDHGSHPPHEVPEPVAAPRLRSSAMRDSASR
jgi:uncharacterized membrane protein YbhN (UPF0104 family)